MANSTALRFRVHSQHERTLVDQEIGILNSVRLFCRIEDHLSDHNFVERPSNDYICPVMSVLLLRPHLTQCCGKHISEEAVEQLNRENKPCPLCNEQLITKLDEHFLRQVGELPVYCAYRDNGCDWEGQLSDLDTHNQSCSKQESSSAEEEEEESTINENEDMVSYPCLQGMIAVISPMYVCI